MQSRCTQEIGDCLTRYPNCPAYPDAGDQSTANEVIGSVTPNAEDLPSLIHCEDEGRETETKELIKSRVKRMNLKSKSVSDGIIELNYEVRLIDDDSSFVNELQKTDGVSRVVLVSYNGDYMV